MSDNVMDAIFLILLFKVLHFLQLVVIVIFKATFLFLIL